MWNIIVVTDLCEAGECKRALSLKPLVTERLFDANNDILS